LGPEVVKAANSVGVTVWDYGDEFIVIRPKAAEVYIFK
jgi:hypothetical protein